MDNPSPPPLRGLSQLDRLVMACYDDVLREVVADCLRTALRPHVELHVEQMVDDMASGPPLLCRPAGVQHPIDGAVRAAIAKTHVVGDGGFREPQLADVVSTLDMGLDAITVDAMASLGYEKDQQNEHGDTVWRETTEARERREAREGAEGAAL